MKGLNQILTRIICALTLITVCAALPSAGYGQDIEGPELPPRAQEDINEGANRIILNVFTPVEKKPDYSPYWVVDDVVDYLQDQDFEVMLMDKEAGIVTTAPRQVGDEIYLRLNVNVREDARGTNVIVRPEWARSMNAEGWQWMTARWTEGPEKEAFAEAVSALTDMPHESFMTATSN